MERLNPPPAPEGRGHGVSDPKSAVAEVAKLAKILSIVLCILLHIFSGGVFYPPYNPPRSPAHSAGLTQKCSRVHLEIDQNFDHFLDSIFDRFWVVLGRQVGVIFGTFGAQDAPSSVQNASWKRNNIKNVNFHPVLRFPIPERSWGAQDDPQNAPRSAQDGPKRLLKSNFFALENHLHFGLV